jgi:hypothetical protein
VGQSENGDIKWTKGFPQVGAFWQMMRAAMRIAFDALHLDGVDEFGVELGSIVAGAPQFIVACRAVQNMDDDSLVAGYRDGWDKVAVAGNDGGVADAILDCEKNDVNGHQNIDSLLLVRYLATIGTSCQLPQANLETRDFF